MTVYVLLAYDEDYYTFETFLGIFRTKEEAEDYIRQDNWVNSVGEFIQEHEEYKIIEKEI